MPAIPPTQRQVNLINSACGTALAGSQLLAVLYAYQNSVALSPTDVAAIADADFAPGTGIPGPLANFDPTEFANFNAAITDLITAIQANSAFVGVSFQALAGLGIKLPQ